MAAELAQVVLMYRDAAALDCYSCSLAFSAVARPMHRCSEGPSALLN